MARTRRVLDLRWVTWSLVGLLVELSSGWWLIPQCRLGHSITIWNMEPSWTVHHTNMYKPPFEYFCVIILCRVMPCHCDLCSTINGISWHGVMARCGSPNRRDRVVSAKFLMKKQTCGKFKAFRNFKHKKLLMLMMLRYLSACCMTKTGANIMAAFYNTLLTQIHAYFYIPQWTENSVAEFFRCQFFPFLSRFLRDISTFP